MDDPITIPDYYELPPRNYSVVPTEHILVTGFTHLYGFAVEAGAPRFPSWQAEVELLPTVDDAPGSAVLREIGRDGRPTLGGFNLWDDLHIIHTPERLPPGMHPIVLRPDPGMRAKDCVPGAWISVSPGDLDESTTRCRFCGYRCMILPWGRLPWDLPIPDGLQHYDRHSDLLVCYTCFGASAMFPEYPHPEDVRGTTEGRPAGCNFKISVTSPYGPRTPVIWSPTIGHSPEEIELATKFDPSSQTVQQALRDHQAKEPITTVFSPVILPEERNVAATRMNEYVSAQIERRNQERIAAGIAEFN